MANAAPPACIDASGAGTLNPLVAATGAQPRRPEPGPPSTQALAAWRSLERLFDRAFGSQANPLRQLGALGFLAFWVLAVSGVWLYVVFDTAVGGAYASIEALSRHPWSVGGLMRSLHRYATDAFVLFTALHLLREALLGRWRGFRGFSWWTGSALVPLLAVSAIGGFWLNWDRLGQYAAIATAEWLDALPLLAQPLARNFLGVDAVSDRLFSLFIFVHLGVPLLLLFGLWFHIQRITAASVFPARRLTAGTLATLLLLAALAPVRGQGAANLAEAAPLLAMDWFVLALLPLSDNIGAAATWALVLGGMLLLVLPPLWPSPRAPVAVVDPANCNGCRRCFADCPYAAITMAPHPDKRPGREIAVVDADLCASCGICAGACPSSTPFRSVQALVTGIDMPQQPIDALRRQMQAGLRSMSAPQPIVAFTCAQGAASAALAADDVLVLPLICTGQLPPSFVEYALRDGAAGVLVASCRDTGCAYRLGARWTRDRLAGTREPHLRRHVPAQSLQIVQADPGETPALVAALGRLRQRLIQIKDSPPQSVKIHHV